MDESEEVEHKSAFDPENLGPVIIIMLMRLYDLQLAFLSAVNPQKADEIVALHEEGHTFAPQPKFVEYMEVGEE